MRMRATAGRPPAAGIAAVSTQLAERLTVQISYERFRSVDSDHAILVGLIDGCEQVTLLGPLAGAVVGEQITVEGSWVVHPRWGEQFKVLRIEEPATPEALLAYLERVVHIGPKAARQLLERHGCEVLHTIDADPHARLSEVPGISSTRIEQAVASWVELRGTRAIRLLLDTHGVPAADATRIVKAIGAASIGRLRRDPYLLSSAAVLGSQRLTRWRARLVCRPALHNEWMPR